MITIFKKACEYISIIMQLCDIIILNKLIAKFLKVLKKCGCLLNKFDYNTVFIGLKYKIPYTRGAKI